MATWKLYEPRGGILRWVERNDSPYGEDFVCYSFEPIEINEDILVGEVQNLSFEEYKKECSELRYRFE